MIRAWHTIGVGVLLLAFATTPSHLFAQKEVRNEIDYPIFKKKKHGEKIVLFPVIVKSPEYLWGGGGAGTYTFRVGKDSLTRTSSFKAVTFATLRKQIVVASEGYIFFPGEQYILYTAASASRFPDKFWGLGNDTPASNLENYTISQYSVASRLTRKLFGDFYGGAGFETQKVFGFDYDHSGGSLFDREDILGRHGSTTAAVGYIIAWDSRNDAFSPSRGLFVQYYQGFFERKLGSTYTFQTYNVDMRKYFLLHDDVVLAFQANVMAAKGDVPIRNLANIGSSSYMRGYYEGRYTDKDLLALQSELRFKVYKRWGLTTFGGIGKVGARIREILTPNHIKPSYGVGVRYSLKPKEKLNLRVDTGFGKHSHGTYVNVGEAF